VAILFGTPLDAALLAVGHGSGYPILASAGEKTARKLPRSAQREPARIAAMDAGARCFRPSQ